MLAFVAAFVTLFAQVLIHRVISAKLLNNYAFLVISLTMLGFAFSGVVLSRWLPVFLRERNDALGLAGSAFAVVTLATSVLFYRSDPGTLEAATRPAFVTEFVSWLPVALLFAACFAFTGLILGTLLSDPALPTRRIYFFDMLGSAAGAWAVIAAIDHFGVETNLLVACALMAAAPLFLAFPRRRVTLWVAAAALGLVGLAAFLGDAAFRMRYPTNSVLASAERLPAPFGIEHIEWDPIARIEVSHLPPPRIENSFYPELIGQNEEFHLRFRRLLTQNNHAFTYAVEYDGVESLRGIETTLYAAAYQATSVRRPRVFAVGVGGGFDILTALYFDASEIVGVEVNGATVRILQDRYRDYFRWLDDPRVELVLGDGRHVLARNPGEFDVIQLSGVDSYSGVPAAAHVFSENYLYTAEAFDLYLERLAPDGIVAMMRLEHVPPREMLRALVTAMAALRRAGVERPSEHVVTLTANSQRFTALLVKKTRFTTAELDRLEAWGAASRFFSISASPRLNGQAQNAYQGFLGLEDERREAVFSASYPWDIRPVDDDRPFFFRFAYWWHLFPSSPTVWGSIPVLEYSLILLSLVVGLAAVLCIYLPLRYLARSGQDAPGARRYTIFFGGIALGYLAIEVALLQKFGLFLGHPNYSLSVVLASMLFFTGLGSILSARIMTRVRKLRYLAYMIAALILFQYALALPYLAEWLHLPFATRVAIAALLIAPVGLMLGVFLPTALDHLKRTAPAYVPWAWGTNGIFSVFAPILSIGISATWGIDALLLSAIPVYMVAGFAFPEPEEPRVVSS